ncbi:glycoside hydrolase family 35 protein [Chitinimonas koreensis]|uniref:glycoside hydrolase family 35 protein n=1 Tax=Chitinimonas koreensis TaxID=356302 RepID=UPI00041C5D82|nr:glycoside hydrolase family 35 protein [Chitinimonas koreensis]QNM98790.1 beta-galactosidase [Chitinimonas koreensis]
MSTFTVVGNDFHLDGRPHRLLSGALHYFRVLPEQWEDRLLKLRALGLNCVETYVAWNLHEPRPGEFDFSGGLDLVAFVRLAESLGLHVIVRPGPYICAEWEFGGLPAWLLADPDMALRCSYRPYLDAVERFFDALLPLLLPLQVQHGGPILAMQVENEYGSYGSDKAYLVWLEQALRERGVETLLFTSDGALDFMLTHGSVPHVLKTANFGSRAAGEFAKLREYQPAGPLMCMEFWCGWFDHWGEQQHLRGAADAAQALDEVLAAGASVNVFMFHGGTSFGFMNGANTDLETGAYQPTVGSYDYDAPLSEDGLPTAKYHAFREVIGKYVELPPLRLPPPVPRFETGTLVLPESQPLFASLSRLSIPQSTPVPRSMESLGQNYGFVLYRTQLNHPAGPTTLHLEQLHDRAQVFVDGVEIGTLERDQPLSLALTLPSRPVTLDILVENLGRVNYGPKLHDRKGILGQVRLGTHTLLHHWQSYPLPLDDLSRLAFIQTTAAPSGPTFYRGRFEVERPGDAFLSLPSGHKGVAWLNGFNLGRYWERGPQTALYVPAPLLKPGLNELTVLELHPRGECQVRFSAQRPKAK